MSSRQIVDTEILLRKASAFLTLCALLIVAYLLAYLMLTMPNPWTSDFFLVLGGLAVLLAANLVILIVMRGIEARIENADTDPLTQLFNRRAFENILAKELLRAGRYRYPLSLCLIDLDGFRAINEHSGKVRGDQILKSFSSLVTRTIRTTDYAGRYHFDEFCILLPHTDLVQAEKFLARFLAQTEEQIDISFSAGVTSHQAGENKAQFLIRAKSALDRAKQEGQRKIVGVAPKPGAAQSTGR
ncbi:MAG: GGDEF domain-containing protein [Candidatus Omnitrophota bacterium]